MSAGLRRGELARLKWEDFDFKSLSTSAWPIPTPRGPLIAKCVQKSYFSWAACRWRRDPFSEVLVAHLEHYIRSGWAHPDELVGAWNSSEAYRILPPAADDPLTVRLFISNVKIALAIVETAWQEPQALQDPRCASQLPSPGR